VHSTTRRPFSAVAGVASPTTPVREKRLHEAAAHYLIEAGQTGAAARHLLAAGPGPAVVGVVWNGTRYVAVGAGGTFAGDPRTILSSTDALTWEYESLPPALNADGLAAVTWTGSQFVAVGGFGNILTSPDGVTWTNDFTGTSGFFQAVANANGTCVAGGLFGLIMVDTACSDVLFRSGFDP